MFFKAITYITGFTVSTWIQPQSWIEPHPLEIKLKADFYAFFMLQSWVKNPERKIEPQGCIQVDTVS